MLACSMGCKPWEFWEMSLRDFYMMQLGYDYHMKQLEGLHEMVMAAVRVNAVCTASPHTKKSIKPTDLFKLPSEQNIPAMQDTPERRAERERKAKRIAQKINNGIEEEPVKKAADLGNSR